MRHVGSVAGRELRSLFVSPVAYAVLSLFAVLAGFFFTLNVLWFDQTLAYLQAVQAIDRVQAMNLNDDLIREYLGSMSAVLLFVVPGITMGIFASEKTNGTQELLMTSPLTMGDIVLGKYLGGTLFVAVLVAIVALYPGLLFVYGDPELGKTLAGLIGLLLVGATYVAIGVFASAVTRSQVVAFLISFVLLVGLLLLPAITELGGTGTAAAGELLRWLSTGTHFEELLKGLVDTADLAYFAVMIGSFLLLTKAAIESVRWR